MPRVTRRLKRRSNDYSDQERQTLLTGVPISAQSTRFGHPKTGWNLDEIEAAWDLLGDELLDEWETPKYDRYRERDKRPFAERILMER